VSHAREARIAARGHAAILSAKEGRCLQKHEVEFVTEEAKKLR
jgi:hypothetical protein